MHARCCLRGWDSTNDMGVTHFGSSIRVAAGAGNVSDAPTADTSVEISGDRIRAPTSKWIVVHLSPRPLLSTLDSRGAHIRLPSESARATGGSRETRARRDVYHFLACAVLWAVRISAIVCTASCGSTFPEVSVHHMTLY